jgi:hypothetical protein
MSDFEIVKFSESYDLAKFIWSHIREWSHPAAFESLLNPADSEVAERLAKPHRDTLLHLFLRRFYQEAYIEEFEHSRNDMLDIVASEYESVLRFNEVSFKRMSFPEESDPDYERKAEARIAYLRSRLPLLRIAQDTFQLLFRRSRVPASLQPGRSARTTQVCIKTTQQRTRTPRRHQADSAPLMVETRCLLQRQRPVRALRKGSHGGRRNE